MCRRKAFLVRVLFLHFTGTRLVEPDVRRQGQTDAHGGVGTLCGQGVKPRGSGARYEYGRMHYESAEDAGVDTIAALGKGKLDAVSRVPVLKSL